MHCSKAPDPRFTAVEADTPNRAAPRGGWMRPGGFGRCLSRHLCDVQKSAFRSGPSCASSMANRKSIRSEVTLPIFGPARPRLSDHPGGLITFGDTVYPGRSTRAETARPADPVARTGPQQGSRDTGQPRAPNHAPDPPVRTCAHPNLGGVRVDDPPGRRGLWGRRRRDRGHPPARVTRVRSKGSLRARPTDS
jgi:hypothetical protein